MRLRDIGREAWRNIGTRELAVAAIISISAAFVAFSVEQAVTSSLRFERELEEAGTYVWRVEPADDQLLRWVDCIGAENQVGIRTSGGAAFNLQREYILEGLPTALPAVEASWGALETWGAIDDLDASAFADGTSLLLGRDLADTLELRLGKPVEARATNARDRTAAVGHLGVLLDDRVPEPILRSAIVVPATASTPLDICWLQAERTHVDEMSNLIAATFGSQLVEATRYKSPPVGFGAGDRYLANAALWSWLPLMSVVLLVTVILGWTRRTEVAVYRALGFSWWELLLMRQTEFLVLAPVPAGTGAFVGLTIAALVDQVPPTSESAAAGFAACLLMISALVASAPAVGLLSGWSDIHALLKDR